MKRYYKAILIGVLLVIMKTLIYNVSKIFVHNPILIVNEIDNHIPFVPSFIYFYCLWYAFLFQIPTILYIKNRQKFKKYLFLGISGTIIISITYILYPTTIIRANFEVTNFTTWLVDLVYRSDYPAVNCFPSGHCYNSLLFILCTYNVKEIKPVYRIIISICSILICMSTVLIKQHVLIDIIGSAVLAIIMMAVTIILEKKTKFLS